jgi:UDP-4-amino-4-deoxy-L-arabinose formyltransferase/UDP-glucuronic acid dehydrogenase (UDP-4-keto-hexauronic acid decarboxylating)
MYPDDGLPTFQALADRANCELVVSATLGVEARRVIKDAHLDIGVSANYPNKIPQAVLDLFCHGVLNAHGGDLPRYRGNACQAWAILNGEPHIGLCIHRMRGDELDTGQVVVRTSLAIDISTSVTEVMAWMTKSVPGMFVEAVTAAETGDLSPPCPSDLEEPPDLGSRCFPRVPEDGRIDWCSDAVSIVRLVKASAHPYFGAFCIHDGDELTIWDADLWAPEYSLHAVPGQVVEVSGDHFAVATGSGCVMVTDCELRGGIPGIRPSIGTIRVRLR